MDSIDGSRLAVEDNKHEQSRLEHAGPAFAGPQYSAESGTSEEPKAEQQDAVERSDSALGKSERQKDALGQLHDPGRHQEMLRGTFTTLPSTTGMSSIRSLNDRLRCSLSSSRLNFEC